MDRVYQSNAIETPPSSVASSGSYPTAGNKAVGQLATVPGPYWFYSITEEIRNAIIAAGLTPDANKVDQLASVFGKFLPLSGGTMSGTIKSINDILIQGESDALDLRIYGGAGYGHGAYIGLRGKSHSQAGIFTLCASDGTNYRSLMGKPDGSLTWRDKELVRSVNGTYADSSGNIALEGFVKSVNGVAGDSSGNVNIYESIAPDWSAGISVSSGFVAPSYGWLIGYTVYASSAEAINYINGVEFARESGSYANIQLLMSPGEAFTVTSGAKVNMLKFYPCKGV